MKQILIALGAVFMLGSATVQATTTINADQAVFHVGEELMVCGNVVKVTTQTKRTLFNLGAAYPKEDVSVQIWHSEKEMFTQHFGTLDKFANQRVCAFGKVESYKNHLFVTVRNPKMLRVVRNR